MSRTTLSLALCGLCLGSAALAKTITISIGYQSMCTDTYPAGSAIKGLKLLDKYLPHTGKYAHVKYRIVWRNYSSGAPITNMMMAGKLDFGTMGDYPLVVNGAKFQQTPSKRSYLITMTGYNLDGAGNGIDVPVNSPIRNVRELEGKDISTPVGSSSWGMLYEMAADEHIPISKLHIVNQSPMAGIAAITAHKIAAHADFCPISEYMEYKHVGRMIYNGASTHVPYLHGAVVTSSFAKKYPQIVVAYVKAVIAADRWIAENPYKASKMLSKWTMIPKEVLYLYFSHGGYLTLNPAITPKWVSTLSYDHSILAKYADIPPLNMKRWVKTGYLKTAYQQMGIPYEKALGAPYSPKSNIAMKPELWLRGKGIYKYGSVRSMLLAAKTADARHEMINALYVYDHDTGLKLFGNYAFYTMNGGKVIAYMTESGAKKATPKGPVYTYEQILAKV